MTGDPLRDAREQINAALQARMRAYANSPRHRSVWGRGLEGERLPGYRVTVTEQTRHGRAKRCAFVLDEETGDSPSGPCWHLVRREARGHERGFGDPLPATVHLAQGVDVPAAALCVVLDANVSRNGHEIDLGDVKRVVSQLGSRLTALDALTAEQQRIAEPALYTEILARCTTI